MGHLNKDARLSLPCAIEKFTHLLYRIEQRILNRCSEETVGYALEELEGDLLPDYKDYESEGSEGLEPEGSDVLEPEENVDSNLVAVGLHEPEEPEADTQRAGGIFGFFCCFPCKKRSNKNAVYPDAQPYEP
jgi:hypothetical protein